jgi:hypothetical protein
MVSRTNTRKKKSTFETIDVNFNLSPEEWVIVTKKIAPRIFSEASCTWFENSTPETLREDLVQVFMNEIAVLALQDTIAEKEGALVEEWKRQNL